MPGFDGTGPRGMGPMTGGGRGLCALPMGAGYPTRFGASGYQMPMPYTMPFRAMAPMWGGYGYPGAGMMPFGRGMGYGMGFGIGRGMGRGMGAGRGRMW